MFFENRYRDNGPLTRIGSVPVYLTTVLVAAMVAGVIFTAFAGLGNAIALFGFVPVAAWKGLQIWRLVSYVFVDEANFFTLFMLLFLYSFGRSSEEELGRHRYLGFLTALVLTPVLVGTVLWMAGFGQGLLLGSGDLAIGFVIAFATIYPNTEWWNWIPMKFVAFGCLFLAAVGHVSHNNYIGLTATLITAGVSFAYIRAMKSGAWDGFSMRALFRRRPKFRVVPKSTPKYETYEPEPEDSSMAEMDMLLDKIAKSGIDSLSSKERARLEQARKELLKRGSPPR
jgi:membrane associated rhomboid family serine protease